MGADPGFAGRPLFWPIQSGHRPVGLPVRCRPHRGAGPGVRLRGERDGPASGGGVLEAWAFKLWVSPSGYGEERVLGSGSNAPYGASGRARGPFQHAALGVCLVGGYPGRRGGGRRVRVIPALLALLHGDPGALAQGIQEGPARRGRGSGPFPPGPVPWQGRPFPKPGCVPSPPTRGFPWG